LLDADAGLLGALKGTSIHRAWLADVLRCINDHSASRLDELLPWNWRKPISIAA
jgi:IS66 C-terminal element